MRRSGRTVSPYLALDRFNTGGLPNYYTLVRPVTRQGQVNLQTQRLQRQQSLALQRLEVPAQQAVVDASGALSAVATGVDGRSSTRSGAVIYQNTLQFYPVVSLRR